LLADTYLLMVCELIVPVYNTCTYWCLFVWL